MLLEGFGPTEKSETAFLCVRLMPCGHSSIRCLPAAEQGSCLWGFGKLTWALGYVGVLMGKGSFGIVSMKCRNDGCVMQQSSSML